MVEYKITVFGAGNQKLYEKLKIKEKFGGDFPFGGAAMAIDFAKAGHDVMLVEHNLNNLTEEMWEKVKSSGVKVSTDDVEGAKHGEISVFFTPYGNRTVNIIKRIIDHFPENAILCSTCSISPVALYALLEPILKTKRKDIGISSLHPMGLPGTDLQTDYIITKECLCGDKYITGEQVNKLVDIVKSINKNPNVIYADVSSSIADVCSAITAIIMAGLLESYKYFVKEIDLPPEMVVHEILISLNTISALVETSKLEGLLGAINTDLLVKSARSMLLTENQKLLKEALKILSEEKDLIKPTEPNRSYLVPSQTLIKEIENIAGPKVANGIIKRSIRTLFTKKYD
ncbi:H(2)-dependent methylenetetrahydromethanopterin dehydrogenase-related protein [Methanocaldococcus sp.]